MASLKDIQRKIGGVKKTKQITKAMNMVASAKLRKAQQRIEQFRPYADKFYEMLTDLSGRTDASAHPLLEVREEIKKVVIVLITADRGLCGSFNVNLITKARKLAAEKEAAGKEVEIVCVGKKGRDVMRKQSWPIRADHVNVMNTFDFTLGAELGTSLMNGYLNHEFDEVIIVFGKFISFAKQEVVSLRVLPIASETAEVEEAQGPASEYIYEPSVEGILAELLPRFVNVQIYRGLLDTNASEHAARMRAMDNATKNCDELSKSLTLVYNKARQSAITTELMDIVGGAEALKSA
ncbi:F0F1 ATP synthase subunit gamma [Desulfonatronum thiodismutans]|uniref:F0F1 ATP synthase subunit gamma n=1 Tax=Desulfonatronum thiodismutans TaxID=159290 RepID=UPI0004ABE398|nr:F0F1 ATP synthase subunit gamma [Desulfonatronum thiodismutans]